MKLIALISTLFLAACGGINTPYGNVNGPIFANGTGLLGADKGKHFLAGMAAATGARMFATEYTTWTRQEVVIAGCAASTTVGIAKELYDRDVMGSIFDPVDAAWTAAGCLFTFERAF